ncbi:hypothetical protein L3X38_003446 [Prunus dulcis]|uniref:Uncharacterized protein n=1 Tax=Prunus dulcis TaxID=3755 RepID=A0AAD5F256_PRUDU|nr:hypothetical protein L3X38_003446 [Prunus dulcis]
MESAWLDAWSSDRAYHFLDLLLSLRNKGPSPTVAISLRETETWVDPPEALVVESGALSFGNSLGVNLEYAEKVLGLRFACLRCRPLGGRLYKVQGDFWNARRSWANKPMDSGFSRLNQFRVAPFKVVRKSLHLVALFTPGQKLLRWLYRSVELVGENDGLVHRLAIGFNEVIFSFVRAVTGGDDFLRIGTFGVGVWDDVTRLRHGSGRRLVAKQASFHLPSMA